VILAGGLGTRMRSHDASVPKNLIEVSGRPFADLQLGWLAQEGVTEVVYSIGHLGEQIRRFVGDGSSWGLDVSYVEEGDELRGTAGALRLAAEEGALAERFFVLYGDSFLQVDLSAVQASYELSGLPALMTVLENEDRWDASNATFDGSMVTRYRKDPAEKTPEMRFIDYGLSIFERGQVLERIPSSRRSDLSGLCAALSDEGLLAGFLATERFYEIGSPSGLAELEAFLGAGEADEGGGPA
jgi:NDP-sugar pyrophosphorylase family protein